MIIKIKRGYTMSKSKKLPARVPEGEAIDDIPELSMDELSESFKRRMKEYKQFVDLIINKLKLRNHLRVLEIGPGPGWITILLAQRDPTLEIIGLEISQDMIRVANKNKQEEGVEENIKYIHGTAENMSLFEENSFDAVISHDSLHHWDYPSKIFNEIARVLKNDGILCIEDGRRDIGVGAKIIFKLAKLFISKTMSYYWKTSIMASYTPEEARNLIDETDLRNRYDVSADLFDLTITSKS